MYMKMNMKIDSTGEFYVEHFQSKRERNFEVPRQT